MGCRRKIPHIYQNRGDEICSKCSSYCCTCIGYLSPKRNKLKFVYSPEYCPTSLSDMVDTKCLPPPNPTESTLSPSDISLDLSPDTAHPPYQDSVISSPSQGGPNSSPPECSRCSPSSSDSSSLYYSTCTSSPRSSPTCTISSSSQCSTPRGYMPLSPPISITRYHVNNFRRGYSPISPKSSSSSSPTLSQHISTPLDFSFASPERTPTPTKYPEYRSKDVEYRDTSPNRMAFDFSPISPTYYTNRPPLHIDSSPDFSLPSPLYVPDRPKPPLFMHQSSISPQNTSPSSPSYCLFSPEYVSTSPDYSPVSIRRYIPDFVEIDEIKSPSSSPAKYRYGISPPSPYISPSKYRLTNTDRPKSSLRYILTSPAHSSSLLSLYHVDSPPIFNGRIMHDDDVDDIPCICCSPLPQRY